MEKLCLSPYKVQLLQSLEPDHKERRFQFAQVMMAKFFDKEIDGDKIWFSDEAYFTLDGTLNKQNYRFWGRQRPEITAVKNLHPKKIMVWCAISARGVFGPVFIESTLKADQYIELLKEEFFPFCHQNDYINDYWFMQDGARPHRTENVFTALNQQFGPRIIGLDYPRYFEGGIEWDPYSPDLNPCDYFLWGYLKSKVWATSPRTIPDLKNAITNEINQIDSDLCKRVISSFQNRLTAVIAKEGGYFDYLYH